MSVYLSEDEQLDAIKKWWNQYGHLVLSVVAGIMMIVVGSQWWQRHQNNIAQSASTAYEQMITSVATHDDATARVGAESILGNFPKTPYAEMSDLLLARYDVEKADYESALKHLNNVIENGKTKSIQQIARVRSAKILLAQKKPAEGRQLLETVVDPSFNAMILEAKGDCYLAEGDKAKARAAYEEAFKAMPAESTSKNLLQIKINDLPGATT